MRFSVHTGSRARSPRLSHGTTRRDTSPGIGTPRTGQSSCSVCSPWVFEIGRLRSDHLGKTRSLVLCQWQKELSSTPQPPTVPRFCLEFPLIGMGAETGNESISANARSKTAAPESGHSPDAFDVRFVPITSFAASQQSSEPFRAPDKPAMALTCR
jgi:hypothetical protein